MKTNHLFTSILALAAIVATSCSTPKLAQQNTTDDDVYNSSAQAKVYTPAPVKQSQDTEQYNEDDYYGSSDPYYDMDYSSRINRFQYGTPWRSYYDPFFYDGWSMGVGIGFGYSPFYGSYWNSPYYGWGHLYSPFWGFNNWGYNNWGWNNYYGGGFLGGGYYGGGYYGGGFYTGRTTNVPNYSARPTRGSRDGYNGTRNAVGNNTLLSPRSRSSQNTTAGSRNGSSVSRPSRGDAGTTRNAPARTETSRPTRESNPQPSYSPPTRSSSGGSSGSSGSGRSSSGGSGSSGGGSGPSRPTRGGR